MIGGKAGMGAASQMGMHAGGKKKGQEMVVITMVETDTVDTLFIPSLTVGTDSHEAMGDLEAREERYEKQKEAHSNPDGFAPASSQTLNNTQKDQNLAAVPTPLQDNGCQAVSFEINEATTSHKKTDYMMGVAETEEDPAGLSASVRTYMTDLVNVAMVSPNCLLDPSNLARPPGPGDHAGKSKREKRGADAGMSTATMGVSTVGGASGVNVGNTSIASGTQMTIGTSIDVQTGDGTDGFNEVDGHAILFQKQAEVVLESDDLLKRLQMVERAVQQNAYHRKQLDYRDLPDVKPLTLLADASRNAAANANVTPGMGFGAGAFGAPTPVPTSSENAQVIDEVEVEEDEDAPKPKTKKLFSYYNADLVQGRSVTAMVWNKVNQDLLAVGYGKLDTFLDASKPGEEVDETLQGGLVLFWSLRNPEYPEKVLRTPSPVTSLEFSRLSPTLLAVGLASGDVCVYDVRREGADWSLPVESSLQMATGSGHTDSVWQVKWVPRGAERLEKLISISSDGRVLEWSIKKGFTVACLMRLARNGQTEGWIARQASGLCFDFSPDDPSTYFVGTEEGSLHKCSISYSEQYLETYVPHNGPVYKVKCAPHWPQVFLTCSADWTMGLYHMNVKGRKIFEIRAAGEDFAITDVCWCPDNSTVFAAVTQNGMLQIWDLAVSCLDPVVSIDTTVDDNTKVIKEEVIVEESEDDPLLPGAGRTGVGGLPPRGPAEGSTELKEDAQVSRITRLVRNLADDEAEVDNRRRVLTSVNFSEKAPAVVVGDNRGSLTVYRIIDPVIITHMGPVQQTEKIKSAVAALDPAVADILKSLEPKADQ